MRTLAHLLLLALGFMTASAGEDMPKMILDPSAADWLVDRFAGNSTAGPEFLQGPARETGGLGRCGACALPDGSVVIPFAGGLAEVDPSGTLRLLLEDSDILQATTAQVCAHAGVAYNPRDKQLYLAGRNCLRRLTASPDAPPRAELVAGTPGKAGFDDGPVAAATFTRIDSLVFNSRGTLFILDHNERIRRIEDGQVTTLNAKVRSGKRTDGPLADATFALIGLGGNLCGGEDDDTLYLSDHWNFCVRRIDLKNGEVTTVAGMPKPLGIRPDDQTPQQKRFNANCDGPALTWASFNSGCAYVCWDPVHRALWCGGPDENRFRWLKEGWLRTVVGAKPDQHKWPKDAVGVPAEKVYLCWNAVVATDAKGGVYLSCSGEPNGLWRAYDAKEAKP
ncbi:MAG TPA: hypothetical protein PLE19_13105 [Planctomycetota bacterium]|nr:hypothetical protein [Planctomycetota bacterium]HRR81114.1 hypothetical protein [Planctomycetota bacterium]HRT96547.1 hypothetical protein [Planctomycetota bacterium]